MRIFRTGFLALGLWILTNSAGAFSQQVYVWQREFKPAVYESVYAIREKVDGIAVLAAEISWSGKTPNLFKSPVSYARLAALRRPVALVLRIGPYAGPFASDDRVAGYLAVTGTAIVQAAKTEGLELAELQIDFDCPSSKLVGYRLWLSALRIAVAPTKLVFTALPDWLGRTDFSDLAHAADGFILQVHSLEKPASPDGDFQLCDPERSWVWIEKAAQMGVRFRVALPTYGYRLAFDPNGKFIALAAEGVSPPWPEGTQVRIVRANAKAMAGLAAKIAKEHPANCAGIIWFRLPVPDEELDWDAITINALLEGRIPRSQLTVEAKWTSPGLVEISLINAGEQDEAVPVKISADWAAGEPPRSMDGLGGYILAFDPLRRSSVVLTAEAALSGKVVAPGRARKIGWMRFDHEIPLVSQILTSP